MTACELCPPEARATTAVMIAGIDLTPGIEDENHIINPESRDLDSYVRQLLEDAVVRICEQLKSEGSTLPAMVMTGGFASEDQVFKGLAYGDGHVLGIGLCRASMAAAMTGKTIGAFSREYAGFQFLNAADKRNRAVR